MAIGDADVVLPQERWTGWTQSSRHQPRIAGSAAAPWPYRGIGTAEALASVRKLLKSQVDPEAVAAIIYEPVQGEGGFLPATPGFAQKGKGKGSDQPQGPADEAVRVVSAVARRTR